MLIPIRHENMSARRWPVVTLALIAINTIVFIATHDAVTHQAPELHKVKSHILILAATHPELTLSPEQQQLVTSVKQHDPDYWAKVQDPNHKIRDAWDARMRLVEEQYQLQQEMDSLADQYEKLSTASVAEQYAFVPAHPKSIAYLTANFLHGGWLHLIGNMWFLWLAGFVLEDAWGRPLYAIIYLIAGAAALQFHAWLNPGSIVPTLGASGAVAALMGAFLVSFPKMKIKMMWIIFFRRYHFYAPAYALLPLWLLMEVFYGTLFGRMSSTAHWAHVGGFLFGAVAALALRYSGLEHKMNQSIEEQVSWQNDPEIVQATDLVHNGQLDQALPILKDYLAKKPDDAGVHYNLGYVYTALKRPADAKGEYEKAISLDPKMSAAYLNLGLTLLPGDPSAAIEPLQHAAELKPADAQTKWLLGTALERSGKLQPAI